MFQHIFQNLFNGFLPQGHKTMGSIVNPFPNNPRFLLQCKSFKNTVGKGEIACNEQFLLFPECFPTLFENFLPFLSNLKLSSTNSKFGRV